MIGKRRGMLLLVQLLIVTVCVSVTTIVAVRVQERLLLDRTIERVTAVAESLADLPAVITAAQVLAAAGSAPDTAAATEALQPLAEIVRQASGVDYVVITDARGIRLTHPTPDARGALVSTDASRVLLGETFVGVEEGTLGLTLRTKVPIWADRTADSTPADSTPAVIGTVSVGLLASHGAADLDEGVLQLTPWVLGSLVFGILAAAGVDRVVGRRLDRLEADSQELDVQRRLAAVLRDQTHEFSNRLHVVYGLVESGDPREALDYIGTVVPVAALDSAEALRSIEAVGLRAALAPPLAALTARGARFVLHADTVARAAHVDDEQVTLTANLVGNAVDAVTARGTEGRVEVLVRADEQGFALTVSDNGPGLDPQLRTRVFERGFSTKRLERSRGIDIPRGVGLALVREIVLRRGGTIAVGRSDAGGARFRVTLPAVALEPDRVWR
ncbi:histidine kinase [Cryobacterium melibiosiphilum]|uniref:histidine kinase n=1 Tax=Cryobacterium melibiosiphilum TaxID=995039 RepID=A0A3A5MSG7_9MICO|nr:ATP-binding protein [Cryobacterium melibiosiphilum]RJT88254.1 histidine kinase [Cryobacterium melibiosiphilum]